MKKHFLNVNKTLNRQQMIIKFFSKFLLAVVLFASLSALSQDRDSLFIEAQSLFNNEKCDEAIEVCSQADSESFI